MALLCFGILVCQAEGNDTYFMGLSYKLNKLRMKHLESCPVLSIMYVFAMITMSSMAT